ncbi:MAG TPA: hypothetical protein VHY31_23740 [Streptosporangiaceae bacterium]|jgi:redox-sensitive bicupin YhaK (pirin superfamily)|nr:hypothetical protein [Streptosporangiaceae bacterium]
MSTVDAQLEIAETSVKANGFDVTEAREARVGDMTVRRLLPLRPRRSVGAWCFVDHYGPMSVDGVAGMRGIAHAEESPAHRDPTLHGVQLWVALPDAARHTEPSFEHRRTCRVRASAASRPRCSPARWTGRGPRPYARK